MIRPSIHIRPAQISDAAKILAIYSHHVLYGTATFEEKVPTLEEMEQRIAHILHEGYPYLVAELENNIVGYAYLSRYRPRSAYRYTAEDSIYLHHEHGGKGIGGVLLAHLIDLAKQGPWHLLVSVIGDSKNVSSIKLHEKFGFTLTGVEPNSGYKFNRWIDTVLMHLPMVTPIEAQETPNASTQ